MIDHKIILERIRALYKKYGVDTESFDLLEEGQKIKGMKGVLAELDLKKKTEYTSEEEDKN